jgi:hypothetical protein
MRNVSKRVPDIQAGDIQANEIKFSSRELLEKFAKLSHNHSKKDWRNLEEMEGQAEVESD